MAKCEMCGQKVPMMGRSAAKNRARVQGLMENLRWLEATMVQNARADGVDEHEIQRVQGNMGRLISEGQLYVGQLHSVSHDIGYPGVNYPAIRRWMDMAAHVLHSPT